MAKAEIKMPIIEPQSTYFICTIMCKAKSGYFITDNSLRLYYSTTPEIIPGTGCPYVEINDSSGAIIEKKIENGWNVFKCRVPLSGDTPLSPNTTYWLRSWMQVYKSNGTAYKKYRGPKNPTPATTGDDPVKSKLFQIASFTNPHEGEDGETEYDQTWVDFTDCIPIGAYNVNYEDVNEDWEDANYVTHRIVPRSKITGNVELKFFTKRRYNEFLKLIKINRQVKGLGYTQLRLHINNDLDLNSGDPNVLDNLDSKRGVLYQGDFFIKLEDNPHVTDYSYGHLDQYETIRIDITEA